MVIIKSKLTGKFLRQHSGSASNFHRRIRYKSEVRKQADKEIGTARPRGTWQEPEVRAWNAEYDKIINRITHGLAYNAEALEARRYTNSGTAMTSIGKFNRFKDGPKHHKGRGTTFGTYSLPEHLEVHEIVAGNLCLVNPDDSEETKRKKEKECE
jgi:hypothetical protein